VSVPSGTAPRALPASWRHGTAASTSPRNGGHEHERPAVRARPTGRPGGRGDAHRDRRGHGAPRSVAHRRRPQRARHLRQRGRAVPSSHVCP